ncbi:MAG: hypothetical protein ABI647_18980 [Gemmatimonadota bacterium]
MRVVSQVVAFVAVALTLAACGSETSSPTPAASLVIHGSGQPAAAGAAAVQRSPDLPPDAQWGGAVSLPITFYALLISPNADCSAPVLVQEFPGGEVKDFMLNPVLFEGSPANGSYQCVIFKMSDVLRVTPSTSFGACHVNTEYAGDIYKDGETDWKDEHGSAIVGHGSEEAPVDDHVALFLTRSPEAALARGISPHQTLQLLSNLIVPGQSTFTLDASNAVLSAGGFCGIQPPQPSFH